MLLFVFAMDAVAQQPFLTDDADVAAVRHFHLELLGQYDRLQGTSYPVLRQSTNRFQLTYGAWNNLEVGVDGPLIAIFNAREATSANAFGLGDVNLQLKYRLRKEVPASAWPAFTIALYVELPTGNSRNQLGSGVADYWLNGIVQKAVRPKLTYRLNAGILFSGNTLTGAIGIRAARGQVLTGASSLTYQARDRLLLGVEVAGALTRQSELGKAALQSQFGGKYALTKTVGIDFAVTAGKFEGSPRLGALLGLSFDF